MTQALGLRTMDSIETNISASGFIEQMNEAVSGLNLSSADSASSAISQLNTAFDSLDGEREITDKAAPDFIGDVNYNLALMDGGETPVVEKIDLPTDRLPKLLFMGNSFSLDSVSYLPFILKAHGIEAIIAICFRHGKTVNWYNTVYNGGTDDDCYLYVCDNSEQSPVWRDFGVRKDSNTLSAEWVFDNPHDAVNATDSGLASYMGNDAYPIGLDGTWDLISIQSFGVESYSTSGTALDTSYPALVSKLINDFGSDFALGFTLPHVIVGSGTPKGVMNRTSSFITNYNGGTPDKKIDIVFPYGTAIYNAWAHEELRSLRTESGAVITTGTGTTVNYSGRQLYGDDTNNGTTSPLHLNEGLPCLIASLTIAETLFRKVSNYDGNSITGNEILPGVGGVYPSGSDWASWSTAAKVRNPNGLSIIYGLDGSSNTIVRNGTIGRISRQYAVWLANRAVDNPYSLVSKRKDESSTNVTVTVNATNCKVKAGGSMNTIGTAVIQSTASYEIYPSNTVWLWVTPDDGRTISEVYWTTAWRVEENSVNDFKVNFSVDGNNRKFGFTNLHENIVIYATAT